MLKGKFFVHSAGEFYQTGLVYDHQGEVLLLQLDDPTPHAPFPHCLVPMNVNQVLHTAGETGFEGDWFLFETREELNVYLNFDPGPEHLSNKEEPAVDDVPPTKRLN